MDTTGDDDIHINDMLVAEGYAEFERVSYRQQIYFYYYYCYTWKNIIWEYKL